MGKFQSKHGEERAGGGGGEARVGATTHCPFSLPYVLPPRRSRSSLQEEREPRR